MSLVEELEELWSNQEVKDLRSVSNHAIDLLERARNQNLNVPNDLQLDILLTANLSVNYGSQPHEASILLSFLDKIRLNHKDLPTTKVYRLGCTVASAIFTVLSSDNQNVTTSINQVVSDINTPKNATKGQIIRGVLHHIYPLVSDQIVKWNLELVSWIMMYYTAIEILSTPNEKDNQVVNELQQIFVNRDNFTDVEQEAFSRWKDEWNEKNDYFRFTFLMLSSENAEEFKFLQNMKKIMKN